MDFESNRERCPETMKLIRSACPESPLCTLSSPNAAFVTVRTHLITSTHSSPRWAVARTSLSIQGQLTRSCEFTYHWYLNHSTTPSELSGQVVPPGGAQLRCADVVHDVKEGEVFIFDDSHEHEAWNHDPTGSRIVLIVDLWHPDFTKKEIKFLKFVQEQQLRVEKESTKGVEGTFYTIIDQARNITPAAQSIWMTEFNSN